MSDTEFPKNGPSDQEKDPTLETSFLGSDLTAGLAAAFGSEYGNDRSTRLNSSFYEPGAIIANRYRLIERIGEGGMGFVWYAEQLEPVKRKVAIKLIKPGLDSRSVLGRFEAERQALAMMDHPNIARVFDGGISETGHPFFVMELVRGTSITRWCDENKVDLRGRLELLIPVCQALHHAHQKGIIHRDIKPSNVMVAMFDGKPVPKVIDFGVAKAFGTSLTEESLHTAFGAVVGTAEYMSPEQAELNNLDIDTRSDVYSLGVLMYELLAGSPPFSRAEMADRGWHEVLRLIREVDPQLPSAKLSTSKMRANIATLRGTEPAALGKLLKSELDWIVMKSLEKERSRRYESAFAMAGDLQRYLVDEPVEACPPSRLYRTRKFVRRNFWVVVACAFIIGSLAAGIVGTSLGFIRAESQRKIAEQARSEADERAAGELAAKTEAQRLQKIAEEAEDAALESYRESTSDAIANLIGSKPELGPKERSYLENAYRRWQSFADRQGSDERSSNTRAQGNFHVGIVWARLGEHAKASTALEQSVSLWTALADRFPIKLHYKEDAAEARRLLAQALRAQGNPVAAEIELKKALQSLEDLVTKEPLQQRYRLKLGECQNAFAGLLKSQGRPEAENEYRQCLLTFENLAKDFPNERAYRFQVAQLQSNLSNFLAEAGNTTEPDRLFRAALATSRELLTYEREAPNYRHAVAERYISLGRFLRARLAKPSEAVEHLNAGIEILNELATELPSVPSYRAELADACIDVSQVLIQQGKLDSAETQLNRAIRGLDLLVSGAPRATRHQIDLSNSYGFMGKLLEARGNPTEALSWYNKAVETIKPVADRESSHGFAHQALSRRMTDRAFCLAQLGRDTPADWEAARDLIPKDGAPITQIQRSIMLLRAGKSAAATQEMNALIDAAQARIVTPPWTAIEWFDAACFFSLASREETNQQATNAARAVELLTRAVNAGFADIEHLKRDPDLSPLRELDEFKKLFENMENAGK